MYVPVKGGERAIENAHRWLAEERRGSQQIPEIGVAQIAEQLSLAVDRVMTEGSLYDPHLAALAIKQARGDLIEAVFLIRAFRTTLPRFGYSRPIDSSAMEINRRISATYKDLPGGQILGPTFDYTHRLLDFALDDAGDLASAPVSAGLDDVASEPPRPGAEEDITPHVLGLLDSEGLIEAPDGGHLTPQPDRGEEGSDQQPSPGDLTRDPIDFPTTRDIRLQNLARGDEGFLLALGYSTQRGYGRNHPFAGEIRMGQVRLAFTPPELGFEIEFADITVTECEMVNQFKGSKTEPPKFTRGYGLVFGHCERKAMSMAQVDRALRANELGEPIASAAQDEEFVLSHSDNVESTGFVEHLKLPHYVDFQAELELVRLMRREAQDGGEVAAPNSTQPPGDEARKIADAERASVGETATEAGDPVEI